MSEVLIMVTERGSLRAEVHGWTHEDASLVEPGHIGMTGSPTPYAPYDCVLRALADGWRLLGPATCRPDDEHPEWEWWLTREKK